MTGSLGAVISHMGYDPGILAAFGGLGTRRRTDLVVGRQPGGGFHVPLSQVPSPSPFASLVNALADRTAGPESSRRTRSAWLRAPVLAKTAFS